MKPPNSEHQRRKGKANNKGNRQPPGQIYASQSIGRKFELHERICEVIGAVSTVGIAVSWFFNHRTEFVWAAIITITSGLFAFGFWFTDHKRNRRLQALPPIALDKPSPTPFKSLAPSPVTEVKSPLPDEADRLTPERIRAKLSEADKEGRGKEIRAAFVGLRVDWQLFFWSAETTDKNHIRVCLTSYKSSKLPPSLPTLVMFILPKDGNERLPLTDKEIAFRVEGTIEDATLISAITLKDVRLTKINPLDAAPSPAKPSVTPKHRTSLSLPEIGEKISKAILSSAGESQEVEKALAGLNVDWTLHFFSASRDKSGNRMNVCLRDPEYRAFIRLVMFSLPLEGHERLPLMEKADVFRVRGEIEGIDSCSVVRLQNATIEWVSKDEETPT